MLWSGQDIAAAVTPYENRLYRVVEDQARDATSLLVDDGPELDRLETLLEAAKPSFPSGIPDNPALYLLTAPFRYRPENRGSRFRAPGTVPGVLYASEGERTALYEFIAWRLRFYLDSRNGLPSAPLPALAFAFTGRHDRAVDVRCDPFACDPAFADRADYALCQRFADEARSVGVGIILYRSVRDPHDAANAALLSWDAIDPHTRTTDTRPVKVAFKEDVVLILRGPLATTESVSHDALLGMTG
ncbi:RES family NAD+ phosphorylase [Eilatimonas milleporae]|uniref:RES domain-containing protein n=1 Tax=Eilatimonas milleporae TaxID=911205 RepID=A0A3M0CGQ6_9PROT|nr:RES family NAD+ phosphorylase [Eilatimonas milleporae]RMB07967.1 RES domain-containing protein [Eilatimonas milleporae]